MQVNAIFVFPKHVNSTKLDVIILQGMLSNCRVITLNPL